ncbi:MAG: Mrp/NBP35 family ATP-binding protein, partial [bacterium]|nr:Mrp/NBP35 family ATP-binding protein [bacterium]
RGLGDVYKRQVQSKDGKIIPISYGETLKVISIGFLLPKEDDPIIWRGPLKTSLIRQFVEQTDWGNLDYLIIDSPPGTGDEPLSVIQLLKGLDGAVIVTTPQEVSLLDSRKAINFAKALNIPVLGIIENMSGFICPSCGTITEIFKTGGGERIAQEMSVPFLGKIPIEPNITLSSDEGKPYIYFYSRMKSSNVFEEIVNKIRNTLEVG